MWKEYKPNNIIYQGATRFWQKEIYPEVFIDFVEYPAIRHIPIGYELNAYLEFGEKSIKIKIFTYRKKDLNQAEKDAKNIIDKLK